MAARLDEANKVGRAYRGRRRILERRVVERIVVQHVAVEDDLRPLRCVVDEGEGGDRAGRYAENLPKELGFSEREPRAADTPMNPFKIDDSILQRDEEEKGNFFILKKQRLAMPTRNLPTQLLAVIDGE